MRGIPLPVWRTWMKPPPCSVPPVTHSSQPWRSVWRSPTPSLNLRCFNCLIRIPWSLPCRLLLFRWWSVQPATLVPAVPRGAAAPSKNQHLPSTDFLSDAAEPTRTQTLVMMFPLKTQRVSSTALFLSLSMLAKLAPAAGSGSSWGWSFCPLVSLEQCTWLFGEFLRGKWTPQSPAAHSFSQELCHPAYSVTGCWPSMLTLVGRHFLLETVSEYVFIPTTFPFQSIGEKILSCRWNPRGK